MRIAKLRLYNWVCYEGDHALNLGAKAYAVVAKKDGDADASNWSGKSSLLESVTFALYGWHRYRTEDDWITRGQERGEVELTFDDGAQIKRSRLRGKATKVEVTLGNRSLNGKEAEAYIAELVGFNREDFFMSCYLEQRAMAKFVLATAADRMKIIVGWFELEKLEAAAELARMAKSALTAQMGVHLNAKAPEGPTLTELKVKVVETEQKHEASMKAWKAASAAQHEAETAIRDARIMAETQSEIERAQAQLAELGEEVPPEKIQEYATHESKLAQKGAQLAHEGRTKLHMVDGTFNGTCPVAGVACPAEKQIEKERGRVGAEGRLLNQEAADTLAQQRKYQAHVQKLRDQEGRRKLLTERLDQAKRHLAGLQAVTPAFSVTIDLRGHGDAVARTADLMRATRDAATEASLAYATREAAERAYTKAQDAVEGLRGSLAALQAAEKVLGRSGAQRRIAERALAQIETMANVSLSGGQSLSVRMVWGREGAGLAKACDNCGEPFPASAKVKACDRCGEARGQHIVPKLELELSDRSGAAEDMVGIAIQLAASSWLRSRRNAAWATALIDEPFGQLDRSNRAATGRRFGAMLQEGGFQQALVVAHSSDVLDSLEGRIEISNIGGRASVRVVA